MVFGFGLGIQRLGSITVDTLAGLTALTPAAGVRPMGFVIHDATAANNGIYSWSGTAWVKQRNLPDTAAVFTPTGGTANAIVASVAQGVNPAGIVLGLLKPSAANTGAVTLNGIPLRDSVGAELLSGALSTTKVYLVYNGGTEYRILLANFGAIADIVGLQAALNAKADASALSAKAGLASPEFTGTPLAPTAAPGTSSQQIATTAFVAAAFDALRNGVSSAFDTLAEIAAGLSARLVKTSNLSDLASIPDARTNLGLGTAAVRNISVGTAAPSGGVDTDIYLKVV